jgi:hypothetical protein
LGAACCGCAETTLLLKTSRIAAVVEVLKQQRQHF